MEFKGIKEKWHIQISHKEDHERISIKTDDISCVGINDYNGDFISVAICGNSKNEVVQANALLISKSPELLKMVAKFINEHETDTRSWETINEAKQLIKEATEL